MKLIKSIDVQEKWFDTIKNKEKIIECQLDKDEFNIGDEIVINKLKNKMIIDFLHAKIIRITKYKSFKDYLSQEGLRRTLPGIKTIDDGINIYHKFYKKEDEEKYGLLAIRFVIINVEPEITK